MIRKRDIQEIHNKLDTITDTTSRKALAYDREQEYLGEVQIRVEKAYASFDEKAMRYSVKIEYKVQPTVLYIDDDGEPTLNTRFRAMNKLNLIPLSDLDLIMEAVNKAKNLNGGA